MGHVVDERKARKTGCACYELPDGELMCYTPGVVGTLSNEQERLFCSEEDLKNPQNASDELVGMQRLFSDTVKRAESRYVELPKEERNIDTWGKLLSEEFETFWTPPEKRRGFKGDVEKSVKEIKRRGKAPKDVKVVERKPTKIKDVEEVEIEGDYDFDVYEKGDYDYWQLHDLVKYGEKVTGIRFEPKSGKRGTADEFYQYIDDNAEQIFPDVEFYEGADGEEYEEIGEEQFVEEQDKYVPTYEELENENKDDLVALAIDDNIPVKKTWRKNRIVNALALAWGVPIPYEKMDIQDLQELAKSRGYAGKSEKRDTLTKWLEKNSEMVLTTDVIIIEEPDRVFYSLIPIKNDERKTWNTAIKSVPKKFAKILELSRDLPPDTELLYKLRDKVEAYNTDYEITQVGKGTILRTIDKRISEINSKARLMYGEDEDELPKALKTKTGGKASKKAVGEKEIVFSEVMDSIIRFSGTKSELDELKDYIERLEPYEIKSKDRKMALKLIDETYSKIGKIGKKKTASQKSTRTVDEDVAIADVSKYIEDVEQVEIGKRDIMKLTEAKKISKQHALLDYEKEYERLVKNKAIESDGAIVELTSDEKKRLTDFRKRMEDWHMDKLKKQFILVGAEKQVEKIDTPKFKKEFVDRIEGAVTVGRLEEIDTMLEEKYLDGENKNSLKKLIKDAKSVLLGEEVPEQAEELQETVKKAVKPAPPVEKAVNTLPSTSKEERKDIGSADITKYKRYIEQAKSVARLDEIGRALLNFNIDADVQELVTQISGRKQDLLGTGGEIAEPTKVSAPVHLVEDVWKRGDSKKRFFALKQLYADSGKSPEIIAEWTTMDWEKLPKFVKKDLELAYNEYRSDKITNVEKSKTPKPIEPKTTADKPSESVSKPMKMETTEMISTRKPTTVEKVDLENLSYTQLAQRLKKLESIKSTRGKLTPVDITNEIHIINRMMPEMTKERVSYYRANLMKLSSVDTDKLEALEKELNKDDALDDNSRRTVQIWIDGRRNA